MVSKIGVRLPYLILAFCVLVLDRWTKAMVQSHLFLTQAVSVIDGFFNITYVQNTGVAFGFLDPIQSPLKSSILAVLTVLAAVGVVIYSWRTPSSQKLLQVALSLILAGALGNLYDRVRFGYVVDFIELYIQTYRWPAFNVADSAITMGVALLAVELFRKDVHDSRDRS